MINNKLVDKFVPTVVIWKIDSMFCKRIKVLGEHTGSHYCGLDSIPNADRRDSHVASRSDKVVSRSRYTFVFPQQKTNNIGLCLC